MRLTIDVDTSTITAEDRRVFMALAGHDAGELRVTMLDEPTRERIRTGTNPGPVPAAPAPPLPVPVPADFAAKLGEAVQQFNPRGSGSEARLPFAQQAGVRTSSTMPDDDEPDMLAQRDDDAAPTPAEETWVEPGDEGLVHTRWGRPEDRTPEASDESEHDAIIRARGGMTVPRELVEEDGDPRRPEDFTRDAILGVIDRMPPMPHTSL